MSNILDLYANVNTLRYKDAEMFLQPFLGLYEAYCWYVFLDVSIRMLEMQLMGDIVSVSARQYFIILCKDLIEISLDRMFR